MAGRPHHSAAETVHALVELTGAEEYSRESAASAVRGILGLAVTVGYERSELPVRGTIPLPETWLEEE